MCVANSAFLYRVFRSMGDGASMSVYRTIINVRVFLFEKLYSVMYDV